ncbi:hypothetical protein FE257_003986 [Aspergillus nanangensis]|uniref:BZIP domain-containing protein n=1 Tax=Aspergillus nanangensis TaxID=2582783 RepID=A0AAD4CRR9_ASPNN|nr:hypothetical protein FE257_003986 [Aspergillus nanangensis]
MRSQSKENRVTKAAAPTEKPDPVERRRLQNRLSQRNHRRKIRDRIAKLQERVIASELRAAATLNNWGYHNPMAGPPPPPPLPNAHDAKTQGSACSVEVSSPFAPPYMLPTSSVCACCDSTTDFVQLASPQTCSSVSLVDINGQAQAQGPDLSSASTVSNTPYYPSPSTPALGSSGNVSAPYMTQELDVSMCPPEPPDVLNSCLPSKIYYIATEASLPQIMQLLDSEQPQTQKAIILIPQNIPASEILAMMNTTASPLGDDTLASGNIAAVCADQTMTELSNSFNWMISSNVCPTEEMDSFGDINLDIA